MKDAQNRLKMEECVFSMGQRSNNTYAALKDAQIKPNKEDSAEDMEQRSNYAALKVVQNKPRGEDYVIDMGHGGQKTRHLRLLGQATNEAFEDALDAGAAAGPGWEQLAHVMEASDLDGKPLETTMKYSKMLAWVFDRQPYHTIQEAQSRSTEPRLDPEGEEEAVTQQLERGLLEALNEPIRYAVDACSACTRVRGWPLGHHSICEKCVQGICDPAMRDDSWTSPAAEVWYRVAQDCTPTTTSSTPNEKVGRQLKIRKCALCEITHVYVPYTELQQMCRQTRKCMESETLDAHQQLAPYLQFIRVVPVYQPELTGSDGQKVQVEWAGPQPPSILKENMESFSAPPPADRALDVEIPLDEDRLIPTDAVEPIEREALEDEEQYLVRRIAGNKVGPCRYWVQWGDGSSSWEPVSKILGAGAAVADYWSSPTGHRRSRMLSDQRVSEGRTESAESWRYSEWAAQVAQGVPGIGKQVAYLAAVQLTGTRHRTQNVFIEQLRQGNFAEDARFTIWVIPQALCVDQGSVLIPVMDVRYSSLRRLVTAAEWRVVNKKLVEQHQFLAMGADVPMFWWHSEIQDKKWGLERDTTTDFVSMDSVLKQ